MSRLKLRARLAVLTGASTIVLFGCGQVTNETVVGKYYEVAPGQLLIGARDFESLQKKNDSLSAAAELLKLATTKNAYRSIRENWARRASLNTDADGAPRKNPLRFKVINSQPMDDKGAVALQIQVLNGQSGQQTWWIKLSELTKVAKETAPFPEPRAKPIAN